MRVPFPFNGLSDDVAYAAQPPLTSRLAKNVRNVDSDSNRTRGGQRSGLSKYLSSELIPNYLNQTEDFSAADWDDGDDTANITVTANTTAAPSGVNSTGDVADTISETDPTNNRSIGQNVLVASLGSIKDTVVTFQVFMQKGTATKSGIKLTHQRSSGSTINVFGEVTWGDTTRETAASGISVTPGAGATTTSGDITVWDDDYVLVSVSLNFDSGVLLETGLLCEVFPAGIAGADQGTVIVFGAALFAGQGQAGYVANTTSTILTASRIQDLAITRIDNRNTTYAARADSWDTEPVKAGTPTDSTRDVRAASRKPDSDGNWYVINGLASLVKITPDIKQVWQFSVPVKDAEHEIRAIWHDPDSNLIYVGASQGGDHKTVELFCIEQVQENDVDTARVRWRRETKPEFFGLIEYWGGFVADLATHQGKLVVLFQNPDVKKSTIVQFSNIADTAGPVVDWMRGNHPYPANSIAIKGNGEILANAEEVSTGTRGQNPLNPSLGPVTVEEIWDPVVDLEDYSGRCWAHFRAEDIGRSPFGSLTDLLEARVEEDAEILRWPDRSGNNRHLYAATGGKPPRLRLRGLGSRPSVSFNGTDQYFESGTNPGTDPGFLDQFGSILPGYDEGSSGTVATNAAAYALFILCRPKVGQASSEPTVILQQDNATTALKPEAILANRDPDTTGHTTYDASTAYVQGQATHYTSPNASSPGDGDGDQPGTGDTPPDDEVNYENANNVLLISVINDGAVNQSDTDPPTSDETHSVLRINGGLVDRYESEQHTSLGPTYVGDDPDATNLSPFEGEIIEILVLDRRDRTAAESSFGDLILTHDDDTTQTTNEQTQIEGNMAHRRGVQGVLSGPAGAHPFTVAPPTKETRVAAVGDISDLATGTTTSTDKQMLVKYGSARGELIWVFGENVSATSGLGHGIAVDSDGNIFTSGPILAGSPSSVVLRRIEDQGDRAVAITTASWGVSGGLSITDLGLTSGDATENKFGRLVVDEHDNVYLPGS